MLLAYIVLSFACASIFEKGKPLGLVVEYGVHGVHCKAGAKIQVLIYSYLCVCGGVGGTGQLRFQATRGSE